MSPFLVRWIKLSLVVVVGCGFLAMAIYAFVMRDEIRNAQIEPPLVAAPEDALKRRPEQPGGMEIPNRDKLVFDLLDSEATVSGAFPVPAPAEIEQTSGTLAGNAAVVEEGGPVSAASSEPLPAASEAKAVAVAAVAASAPVSTSRVGEAAAGKPVAPAAGAQVQQPVQVAQKPAEKTVDSLKVEAKTAAPAEKVAATPAAASEPKGKVAGGSWSVQLAAVGSKADGDRMAAKLVKQYPALNGLSPRMEATPDGKRFRVQFSGLKDRNAAAALCSKLGSKQACFPVAPK